MRPVDPNNRYFGLADGESVVFHRPDGPWIGLASLGGGATLRIEAPQRGIAVERLALHLGPEAAPSKQLCLRCGLILDQVIVGHHATSPEHRAHKDPWLEPSARPDRDPAATSEPELWATTERFTVTMKPLLISVADAARVLGLSRSTISELARKGTIPSIRIGSRVLLPVKALEQWIGARVAEDAERSASSWSRLRGYAQSAGAPIAGRGTPLRRTSSVHDAQSVRMRDEGLR